MDFEELLIRLESPAPTLRRQAIVDLGRIGDLRAAPPLIDRLADEDQAVADQAEETLKGMRSREVASRLVTLLSVEQVGLRNRAMELLRCMGGYAPDLILDLLNDSDRDLRIFAADILGTVQATGVGKALIKALRDEDPNVRAAAASSLGKRRGPNATQPLIDSLGDQQWVCFAAIESLAQIGDQAAVEPLINCMERRSDLVRAAAALALARFKGSRPINAIVKAMRHADGPLLRHLLSAFLQVAEPGRLKRLEPDLVDRAYKVLMGSLDDYSAKTRAEALRGLAELGNGSTVPHILSLARDESDEEVAELIKQALAAIGEIGPLVGAACDENPFVAATAVEVLGRLGGKKAVAAISEALSHADPGVRRIGARALGGLGSPEGRNALVASLCDKDNDVLVEVIAALESAGDKSLVPAIAALLGHEERKVRQSALATLMSIGGQAVGRVIEEGLGSPNPRKREICAYGLGKCESQHIVQKLSSMLDDPDFQVRKAALLGLMRSDDKRVPLHLEKALADPDPQVRLTLVRRLAESPSEHGQKILIKALGDNDPDIRLHAVAGLGRTEAQRAMEPLLDILARQDSELQMRAAEALGALGNRQAYDGLMNLLKSSNPEVRDAATKAIHQIHNNGQT